VPKPHLDPCPHCGSTEFNWYSSDGGMRDWPEVGFKCKGCGIVVCRGVNDMKGEGNKQTRKKLARIWNTRVEVPSA